MTEPRGLFVELDKEAEFAEAEEIAPGVVAELDAEGKPVAVEIADVENVDVDVLSRGLTSLSLSEADVRTVIEAVERARQQKR
jgi:hypothetical protein